MAVQAAAKYQPTISDVIVADRKHLQDTIGKTWDEVRQMGIGRFVPQVELGYSPAGAVRGEFVLRPGKFASGKVMACLYQQLW